MTHTRLDMISFAHLDRVGSILQIEITDWHDQLALLRNIFAICRIYIYIYMIYKREKYWTANKVPCKPSVSYDFTKPWTYATNRWIFVAYVQYLACGPSMQYKILILVSWLHDSSGYYNFVAITEMQVYWYALCRCHYCVKETIHYFFKNIDTVVLH